MTHRWPHIIPSGESSGLPFGFYAYLVLHPAINCLIMVDCGGFREAEQNPQKKQNESGRELPLNEWAREVGYGCLRWGKGAYEYDAEDNGPFLSHTCGSLRAESVEEGALREMLQSAG